jgi:single-strand DNA-binding protein
VNTQVTLNGNIGGGDPELRFLPSGVAVAKFRMACTPQKYNKDTGKWEDLEPSWYAVTVWRNQAENVAESLRNGDRVIVLGNLSVRVYEDKEGNKRTSTEVDAQAVGADLTFATAKVIKAAKSGGGTSRAASGGDGWGDAKPAQARPAQAAANPADSW